MNLKYEGKLKLENLTTQLVNELIDKIVIHQPTGQSNKKRKRSQIKAPSPQKTKKET